ncbi:nitrogenase component I subunit alpha [Roseiflexus castenholzii]|jgi:nitrogenase molybdenum-iron protein alpha chain|uniref:nitrogenase n=1 Tax=Roseiflexus castenholzii (strain DSM 13941 / HLO8) TaxID=383372 RepID=A7NR78_ROSCS|nr:nitrogenase component I subunit alpha [Roseiflexus castenholzii]ABU60074.1 nitrogenase component I, alpha chain [Roseiflexus castenholzii DSM 13941]
MQFKCNQTLPERAIHIALKGPDGKCQRGDGTGCFIANNVATTPGDMTERGCTYAGCRGVVGGPVKDAIQLTHGPIGCAFFSWGYRPHLADSDFHMKYTFVSDMNETNIVFGGEKKLLQSIIEASAEFPDAKAVFVYNTCSTALIGDDGRDVAKQAEAIIGKPVVFFECEGFRGVSQSMGHHVGNETIFRQLVGSIEPEGDFSRSINIIGDYNIKNDIRTFEYLFEALGLQIIARFTGNVSVDDLKIMHKAALNIVHCQRSATYIADMMKEKYGTPSINVTLWGIRNMAQALRAAAAFFGLETRAEEVIAHEVTRIQPYIDAYRQRLHGKRVFIYQGGPRVWHWIELLRELGMETETAATTFGHTDDYEKIFNQIPEGALVIDNPNVPEIEEILNRRRPDLFISGNKERYLAYKLGVPFVNGHTYDTGPYAGFVGMVNFARDIDKALHAPVWNILHQRARPAPATHHAAHGFEEVES